MYSRVFKMGEYYLSLRISSIQRHCVGGSDETSGVCATARVYTGRRQSAAAVVCEAIQRVTTANTAQRRRLFARQATTLVRPAAFHFSVRASVPRGIDQWKRSVVFHAQIYDLLVT